MKNIHILPTDQPSRLHLWTDENGMRLALCELEYSHTRNTQHIYITSDEEIKEGVNQWYLDKFLNKPMNSGGAQYGEKQNIIILTTDSALTADGVQSIDDEFLKWFVKNPTCEFVEVKKQYITPLGDIVDTCYDNERLNYKIIIPQEEPKQYPMGSFAPGNYWHKECVTCKKEFMGDKRAVQCEPCAIKMTQEEPKPGIEGESFNVPLSKNWFPKQETLEEAAERYAEQENKSGNCDAKEIEIEYHFKKGAKWQAEKMYSEQIELINWLQQSLTSKKFYSTDAEDLIEQFKKK